MYSSGYSGLRSDDAEFTSVPSPGIISFFKPFYCHESKLTAPLLEALILSMQPTNAEFIIPAPPLSSLNLSSSITPKKAQIAIAFYEKKTRKAWFSKSEEEVCWEQWTITVSSITPRNENERALLSRSAEQQLQNILFKIIDFVGENKTHIPSITSSEGNPFPYSIALPSEAEESWGSVFKKILVE